MFLWEESKIPSSVSREEFVEKVFYLGVCNHHTFDLIIAAIELADNFISFIGPRLMATTVYDRSLTNIDQIYSIEMAYAVTLLYGKVHTDNGYRHTRIAMQEINNAYISKIEKELLIWVNYHVFKPLNFADFFYKRAGDIPIECYQVFQQVMMSYKLSEVNQNAVIAALILLGRRLRLKSEIEYRKQRSLKMLEYCLDGKISYERLKSYV